MTKFIKKSIWELFWPWTLNGGCEWIRWVFGDPQRPLGRGIAFSSRKQTLASVQAPQGLLANHGRRRESPAHQLWGVSDLGSWKNPVAKRLEATGSPGRLPQPSSILNNSDTLQS